MSFAPGGWRSMTTWPTAATSDVAPGRSPASSSETPSAVATATIPASAAGQSRSGGRGGRQGRADEVPVAVLTGASSPLRCDIRMSRVIASDPLVRLARSCAPRRAHPATPR